MAEWAITTATLSMDTGSPILYDAQNVDVNYAIENLEAVPTNATSASNFSGLEAASGSFSVYYDDITGDPSPMSALFAGASGEMVVILNKSSGGSLTLTVPIVISDTSINWSFSETPMMEVTYTGNGAIVPT